ncbi:hypothetical protein LWI29_006271 [Acer saccharum]|uniref:Protein kinase domain-containing protein n=1 Tax=Acer saccharum TaxID=4024 RepID=A0AA39RTW7_ACESA|nr:hypothetical protein LWI29_006271 [Acer saccharum]
MVSEDTSIGRNPNLVSTPIGKGAGFSGVTERGARLEGGQRIPNSSDSFFVGDSNRGFLVKERENLEKGLVFVGNSSGGALNALDVGLGPSTNPPGLLRPNVGLGGPALYKPDLVGLTSEALGLGVVGKNGLDPGQPIGVHQGIALCSGLEVSNQQAHVVFGAQKSLDTTTEPNLVGKWKRRARNHHQITDYGDGGLVLGRKLSMAVLRGIRSLSKNRGKFLHLKILLLRGVPTEGMCPRCHRSPETTLHALWECRGLSIVRDSWANLRNVAFPKNSLVLDFMVYCSKILKSPDLELLCVMMWRVWFCRNNLVHNLEGKEVGDVANWSVQFLEEWSSANRLDASRPLRPSVKRPIWCPPEVGMWKINSDAALCSRDRVAGLGFIVRNSSGNLCLAAMHKWVASFSPLVAEVLAVKTGVQMAIQAILICKLGLGFGIGDWLILDKVSDSSVTTVDGRKWVGDLVTNKNVTLSSVAGVAVNTSTTLSGDSIFKSLYKSARIFADGLNYTFEIVPGNYIVRLHFCPFPFENYNVNESSFSVVANGFKLLSQLSVPGEISHKNMFLQNSGGNASFSLVKEYMLGIHLDMLRIELIPNKGSFGFVNAIEIVPVVDELFADAIRKVGGNDMNFNLSGRGIETMYRLNVGGPEIKPNQDSDFWRTWEVDSSYMITANAGSEISNTSNITYSSMNDSSVAPVFVYETARIMSNNQVLEKRFNMSWKFEVDPDFDYLVRLHFCELVYDKAHQRIFRIYINNRTAANNFDIFAQSGGMNRAYHQDYFDAVSSKVDTLWIQLGPDTAAGASGTDALLNGLEVFKLSRNGNLAYVEKYDSAGRSGGRSKNWILWVGMAAGIASVAILAVIVTIIFYICKNRREKSSDAKNNSSPGWCPLFLHRAKGTGIQNPIEPMAPTRVGKRFMLAEIRAATNNFDDSLVIGVGGFGKVYKGEIEDGSLAAIKRANPQSEQGLVEFETEIEMLSKLRHRHLVTLIGFCEEQNEMILVYEYMANGTLRSHLFGSDLPPLSWKQRLDTGQ